MVKSLILPVLVIFSWSCNEGLSPAPPVRPGFSGTVLFATGTWPGNQNSPDSLANLWVFASQDYPLDSALVFNGLFSNPPRVYLYPSFIANLPFYVDSCSFTFELPPGVYKYVGVIQHITPDYTSIRTMRVVGFASDSTAPSQPMSVTVIDGQITSGIIIKVDFHNPPPQPF